MDYLKARTVAEDVCKKLAPACERIRIAGSIRRRAAEVKDAEIVYVAKGVLNGLTLFSQDEVPMTDRWIETLVEDGYLRWDEEVRRNGPKYKRLIDVSSGLVVELFRATRENWGLIFALRTGPAAFMKRVAAHGWDGGVMPVEYEMHDGHLWRRGTMIETPTEEVFFRELGLPCWPPEHRNARMLMRFAGAQATVARFE